MTTIAERVAKGAALLDEKRPGWDRELPRLSRLSIANAEQCILGQLYGYFYSGVHPLGLVLSETDDYGFSGVGYFAEERKDNARLTRAWKSLIRERRSQATARPAEGRGEG